MNSFVMIGMGRHKLWFMLMDVWCGGGFLHRKAVNKSPIHRFILWGAANQHDG